ncbi:MAG: D-arabinono-1,4-lactone oxidase [Spirochaetaceae bacterium]
MYRYIQPDMNRPQSKHIASKEEAPADAQPWVSWNGRIVHTYDTIVRPGTEEEFAEAVRSARRVRVYGNKQSSSDIAAGTETLIDTSRYSRVLAFDEDVGRVTVQSGITLKALMHTLESRGWTLPCLPDIDTVTIGGALATGTHGTAGDAHPLTEYMVAARIIKADGSIEEVDEASEIMPALRTSLGTLGALSAVTFQLHPLYHLRVEEQAIADAEWLAHYRRWLDEYDFVRIIWLPHTGYGWVVLGERIDADTPVEERTAPRYVRHRREVSKLLYKRTLRFPRFTRFANRLLRRLFFAHRTVEKGTLYGATVTKSRSSPLELAEWTVSMDRFEELFARLRDALESPDNGAYAHIPMDIRFLKGDETWLSNAYGRDTVTVGCVTRNPEHADEYAAFDLVERIFLEHGGRPHWAKRFRATARELAPLYPRWDDFVALRRRMDPEGTFLNSYLAELFE